MVPRRTVVPGIVVSGLDSGEMLHGVDCPYQTEVNSCVVRQACDDLRDRPAVRRIAEGRRGRPLVDQILGDLEGHLGAHRTWGDSKARPVVHQTGGD